jgi:hypothetical protein
MSQKENKEKGGNIWYQYLLSTGKVKNLFSFFLNFLKNEQEE